MRKTRDIFKNIRDTKGIFQSKMVHNKGQKQQGTNRSKRYCEVVVIPRRTIQNGLNDLDKHNGILTHLEQDILECEVK